MRRMRPALLLVVALALFAAACSDDDATTSSSSPSSTSPSTTTTATTSAPSTTSASGGGDEISALIRLFETTALRTTYLFGEGTDQTEVTLSQDPTADPPLGAVLVPEADFKLITIGEETIFCDTVANTCFEVAGATGPGLSAGLLGPFAGGLFMAGQLDAIPGASVTGDRVEIAGRSGICFSFRPPESAGFDTEEVKQCIDSELGFTLLLETQESMDGEAETIMILTEFGDPLPEDFEPTGPVTPSS